ncbi:MAG: type II secretion system protein GspG [Planctomycetaceae bacterium]|jgi:hypothetical protein|nr:hypothetical protein [Phycisphaerales bacterium]MCE2654568.1 type II secretion system protein GspG [Planctomycetaceae bacterium]
MTTPTRPLLCTLVCSAAALLCFTAGRAEPASAPAAAPAANTAPAAPAITPDSYIRVVDDAQAQRTTLELAIRSFQRPDGSGPVVHLVSAVHIADKAFYEEMQRFLDAQDVVLFEGVKPPGAGRLAHLTTDEQRATATRRRLEFLSSLIEKHWGEQGAPPKTLQDLAESNKRFRTLVTSLLVDGWGKPIVYTPPADAPAAPATPASPDAPTEAPTATLLSFGADVAPGGAEAAADITVTARKPAGGSGGAGGGGGGGLQAKLAKALNLTFQLDGMDSSKPNWRSSDLAIDEVQERLARNGADGRALLSMLDGSSLSARVVGLLLNLIAMSDTMSTMAKAMMVETLGASERMFQNDSPDAKGPMGAMGPMMKVIVHDRNDVVVGDLQQIFASEPNVRSVAAFYGAAHMTAFEEVLREKLGLRPIETRWVPAISVDLKAAGMSLAQMQQMRRSLERQLGGSRRTPAGGKNAPAEAK